MPPLGLVLGNVNFSSLFLDLSGKGYATLEEAKKAGAPTLNYGSFIQSIIDFLLVVFPVFLLVRWANRFKAPAAAVATKECPFCTSAIPIKATRCPLCTSEIKAA